MVRKRTQLTPDGRDAKWSGERFSCCVFIALTGCEQASSILESASENPAAPPASIGSKDAPLIGVPADRPRSERVRNNFPIEARSESVWRIGARSADVTAGTKFYFQWKSVMDSETP